MATIMELAREIIIRTYGTDCPHIADVRNLCGRWDSRYIADGVVSCDKFRQTIIPTSHQFVIKTGLVQGGVRQCRRELDFYCKAESEGLERYFAKCYGTVRCGSCTFYVYEYVDGIGRGYDDAEYYIEDEHLLDFIDENEITDLHYENFALDEEGNVVLTDYSGYWVRDDHKGMKTIYSDW